MTRRYLLFGSARDRLDYLQARRPDAQVFVVDDPDVLERKRFAETARRYSVVEQVLPTDIYGSESWIDTFREQHRREPFTAVLPGLEYPSVAAATAALALGLPGAGPEAARLHRNKEQLVERAAASGIATPRSQVITTPAELAAFEPHGRWVLKPTDRQASVGVQVLDADADRMTAWQASTGTDEGAHLASLFRSTCLAQDFVEGPEFSVEMLVSGGRPRFANVTAKTVKVGVHPVELGHVVPADISTAQRAQLIDSTRALVAASGLDTGLAHAEWIVDGEPHLVECAARLPGDSIVELIDLAYGIDLEGAWLDLLSGIEPEPLPDSAVGGATIRFLDLGAGRVDSVRPDGLSQHNVVRSELPAVGDRVGEACDSWTRAGELVVTGRDAADATARADAAVADLGIVIVR